MNQTVRTDLNDMTSCLESLIKMMPKLSRAEKIDVGARINAVKNVAEKLDKSIKHDIENWRKGQAGEVKGELFKAVLTYNDVTRLNQGKLKEKEPVLHTLYCETAPEHRIVYILR